MRSDHAQVPPRPLVWRAARHHFILVVACLIAGVLVGWFLSTAQPRTYASSANVLVNPAVGNPFAPTPASVRQDEATSLETEARVARSAAVLSKVAVDDPSLTLSEIQRGASITVPPNTQVLELTFTSADPGLTRQVVNAWAKAYLANREARSGEVNAARIARVESQTQTVVEDLRAATVAAQAGSGANRLFQTELASALRNQLVSLRAQRSYLETSVTPAGSVISPASRAVSTGKMTPLLLLGGGALGGLVLGCLIAAIRERAAGVVRSAAEVEATGLPVLAASPAQRPKDRLRRIRGRERHEATIRRVRAKILDLRPTPQVIAVTPVGAGGPDAPVTEALAESFARAGLRVALVRTDTGSDGAAGHGVDVARRGLS